MFHNHIISLFNSEDVVMGVLPNYYNTTNVPLLIVVVSGQDNRVAFSKHTDEQYKSLCYTFKLIYGGILIPPSELLMKWAEINNFAQQQEFDSMYANYLMNPECDNFIITLIASLVKFNVILYIPEDEFKMFGMNLFNHFLNYYGITLTTATTSFNIDERAKPMLLSKLFMENLMDADQYLMSYPKNIMLPDYVINKLAIDLRPFNMNVSFDLYRNYFNRLVANGFDPNKEKIQLYNLL